MWSRPWLVPYVALAAAGWGGNQFTPLVLLYRTHGHSAIVITAVFAAYVLGLVPGFLIGGARSDRHGRRIVRWALLLSAASSVVLAAGADAAPMLLAGRVLTGFALGVTMAAGTSWVKELSGPPESTGARRASSALTVGFMAGPVTAGLLAQWGPAPLVTPYVVHAVLAVTAALTVGRAPETVTASSVRRPSGDRVFVDDHRPLWTLVLPAAPWVFGGVAVSIVVQPTVVAARLGDHGTAYATLLTAITLATGLVAQSSARRRIERDGVARTLSVALALLLAGLLVAVAVAATGLVVLPLASAVLFGASYGLSLPAGLVQVQRLAAPGALARATAVYYSLTYAGFGLPLVFSVLRTWTGAVPIMAGFGVLALVSAAVVARTAARSKVLRPFTDEFRRTRGS